MIAGHHRSGLRCAALLFAACLLVQTTLSLGHGTEDAHVYCHEHDQLEHVDGDGHGVAESEHASVERVPGPHGDHDACLCDLGTQRPSAIAPQTSLFVALGVAAERPARERAAHTPLQTLSLAPKTSPPA